MTAANPCLFVVPHTHWDREWYRTHEEFRLRLVRLVDRLLDLLEGDPEFRCFTLDGQTIVADDYLAVRPEARPRLEALVRAGRLRVGPWTVLPDEWLVSGEALIRNLRLGLARADALGGAMRVGYVPDQFGHVGQLPQIFAGFGLEAAALWRGVGADVDRNLFHWEAPDGTRLLTVYLSRSYSNGAYLPSWPEGCAELLQRELEGLGRRSPIDTLLVMNGTDHAEPDPELPRLLSAAAALLPGVRVEIGGLPEFVARARAEAPAVLPVHRGELRSGLRAPLLVGCASARMPQKQRDFRNDRLLTRWLEPLAAWLGALGGEADPGLIEFAWRIALENHPHDSICGCSVDAVHEQMEPRFARVRELAESHLQRVFTALAGRVAAPSTAFGGSRGVDFVVWNPNAAGTTPVEALVELDGRGPFCVRSEDGRGLPAEVERVEPVRHLFEASSSRTGVRNLLGYIRGGEFLGTRVRDLTWASEAGGGLLVRLELTRVEAREQNLDERRQAFAAVAAGDPEAPARFVAVLPAQVRVRFVDALPGWGLRVYRLARGRVPAAAGLVSERLARGGVAIQNGFFRVEVDSGGRVAIERVADGLRVEDALRIVSEGDRGDEYNFDPLPAGGCVERPDRVRVELERPSSIGVGLRIQARYRVPVSLDRTRAARARRRVTLPVELRVGLSAGVDRVDLGLRFVNRSSDHRLRLHVRAPFAARRFRVESAFEVVERPIVPRPEPADRPAAEQPIGTVPQRTFAVLDDGARALSVANRGNAEVEAVPEANGTTSLALTLVRSVGWLSRDDLALRPQHAGPPFETPGAQVPGAHEAEFGVRWHAADDPDLSAEAHRFAHPPLATQRGGPADGSLRDGERLLEVDDPALIVSALEPRSHGRASIRLYNASPEPRRATVRCRLPGVRGLERVSLAEDPVAAAEDAAAGTELALDLRPWQIVTLRTR